MAKIRMAINGFGRIGRHAFKIAMESKHIQVVAINDLTDNKTLAHLLKHDTAYPMYEKSVSFTKDAIVIGKKKIPAFSERNPEDLPWKKLKVDVVLECTGVFRTKEAAERHLTAGAKKVLISAPGKGEGIVTLVKGINEKTYKKTQKIVDNASCTTNCTAPIMQVMESSFGIKKAMLTTVHSYTADQRLQDAPHKDLRRARAANLNIVPTSTGAAIATTKVIPSLVGKFDGMSIRVPTITVSLTDITLLLKKKTTIEEVNRALTKASKFSMKGLLAVSDEPLVSSDYIGNPYSCTVDLAFTNVVDKDLVKIVAWYDNEWGYANRLVEMAAHIGS